MASWMVHLRIADYILNEMKNLEETEYIVGNIAPDSGIPSSDWKFYTPSGKISHFKNDAAQEEIQPERFFQEYLTEEKRITYDSKQLSFYLGYYNHLLADVLWHEKIVESSKEKDAENYKADSYAAVWKWKKDWYDLDFLYLSQHPDFHSFLVYEKAKGFRNTYLDFFAEDAFDNRREYICSYYRGENKDIIRDYTYLTEKDMDAFVEYAGKTILEKNKKLLLKKNFLADQVDVCVIGAGHAGCEAALACARLGLETVIFTVSVDSIALMPCNPNVGGSSKGHLVREVDALGGEMGKNIDKTFIQSKMLNVSKGPAVHSLRAQADKADYSRAMRKVLENQEHLTIKQAEVTELLWEEAAEDKVADRKTGENDAEISGFSRKKITGVKTFTGAIYKCRAVVLCTGTYLRARCLCGESITHTGPNGLQAANHLTDSLKALGIEMRRFKTGTPARMDRKSLDFSKMEEQFGDEKIVPFSFSTNPDEIQKDQVSCYLTYTNEKTHEIIRSNLDRSPIYAGIIEGTGPRYCPSIEDKVVKFADKERHQVFIEPEGLHTDEMYISGMSSSLPEDVQLAMYRTVPGLENCKMVRNAYAIEYDCINAKQLYPTLEFKNVSGLFAGGQFNGSSGYEEAAAQGLIAGINAAMLLKGKEPLILDRSEAYIGVLIDDLVTKDNYEPYRMMTSRAEYRLLLRQDNADLRLRKKGFEVGLITKLQFDETLGKKYLIEKEIQRLKSVIVGASEKYQVFLEKYGSSPLKTGSNLAELMCRPELNYEKLGEIDPDRKELPESVIEQVEIEIKYEGYIERQLRQVEQFKKMEKKRIPEDIDYDEVPSLRIEARQKLKEFRPISMGQASRISGVSPADISVLLVYLEHKANKFAFKEKG